MVYRVTLIAAIFLVFAGSILANKQFGERLRPESTPRWECRRIVSMAPGVTETLYALGLGDRVVGVTRYCDYPPEVKEKARVGGFLDPNLEAIVVLKPDLVVLLEEQAELAAVLAKLELETLVVNHQTIDGVIDSFRTIGRRCGKGSQGRQLARRFEQRLRKIRAATDGLPRPRVLFVLDRAYHTGRLTDVYVAGADEYFDAIVELAGGRNACRVRTVRNPVLSAEGIMRLDPEVIVDLARTDALEKRDPRSISADWRSLSRVKAVRDGRLLVFDKAYAGVPGPRIIQLVEDLARELHPEAEWEKVD
ncbi:MAG: ABC transporter substrate-binding protein [Pirellulales bacterium]|nr:ABC transporter substrate-binding protein [Pirellulales bacterium]